MCYPKPGPRCAPHAREKLKKANAVVNQVKSALDNAYSNNANPGVIILLQEELDGAKDYQYNALSDYQETSAFKEDVDKMLVSGRRPNGDNLTEKKKLELSRTVEKGQVSRELKIDAYNKMKEYNTTREYATANPDDEMLQTKLFEARREWFATSPGSEEIKESIDKLKAQGQEHEASEKEWDLAHAMLYKKYQKDMEFSRTEIYSPEQEKQEKKDASLKAYQHLMNVLGAKLTNS